MLLPIYSLLVTRIKLFSVNKYFVAYTKFHYLEFNCRVGINYFLYSLSVREDCCFHVAYFRASSLSSHKNENHSCIDTPTNQRTSHTGKPHVYIHMHMWLHVITGLLVPSLSHDSCMMGTGSWITVTLSCALGFYHSAQTLLIQFLCFSFNAIYTQLLILVVQNFKVLLQFNSSILCTFRFILLEKLLPRIQKLISV